jgi:hypothetical protein
MSVLVFKQSNVSELSRSRKGRLVTIGHAVGWVDRVNWPMMPMLVCDRSDTAAYTDEAVAATTWVPAVLRSEAKVMLALMLPLRVQVSEYGVRPVARGEQSSAL